MHPVMNGHVCTRIPKLALYLQAFKVAKYGLHKEELFNSHVNYVCINKYKQL